MSELERSTLELIHTAAKAEFMEKGFQAASLRNIVKTGHFTAITTARKSCLRLW